MGPWDPSQPVRVAISFNLPHRFVQMDEYGAGNDLGSFNLSVLSCLGKVLNMHLIYLLYLVECFKYAFHILTVSDGMFSINLGGLQADIKGGSGGGGSPPRKYGLISLLPVPGQ